MLEIRDLHVQVQGSDILNGVNLTINDGEVCALMGPNGAGKSTLGYALMGHPDFKITQGSITFNDEDMIKLAPHKRAMKGMFLSFQYPSEVAGVSIPTFLRTALTAVTGKQMPVPEFLALVKEKMKLLGIEEGMLKRHLNEGFSGGEKKKMEILQMAVLNPRMGILDETDSGLDVDALRSVATGINTIKTPEMGILLITHYQRILGYIKPDTVHIMMDGKIVRSGDHTLAQEIEVKGYVLN